MGCCFSTNRVSNISENQITNNKYQNYDNKSFEQTINDINDEITISNKQKEIKNNNNSSKEIKPVIESDEDREINDWINLINNLVKNKSLNDYAKSKKRTEFKNLNDLAEFIKKYPVKNETEKVWLLYVWISENISYDAEGFKNNSYSSNIADSVLTNGKAVCSGYSNLFENICNLIGIECKTINGYAKGFGYVYGSKMTAINHAWNAVKLNNKWYYIESTWASGTVTNDYKFNKRFEPFYFLTPPNIFLERHYSDSFQLHRKCTLEEYENLLINELQFYILGFKCKTLLNQTFINFDKQPGYIEFTSNQDCDLTANLVNDNSKKNEKENYFIQKDNSTRPVKYGIILFLSAKNQNYYLELFCKKVNDTESEYKLLTRVYFKRTGDNQIIDLPKYNISLNDEIKLISHQSKLISFETNPLKIELKSSNDFNQLLGSIHSMTNAQDNQEGSVLIQKNIQNSNINVYVNLLTKNKRMVLNLFKRDLRQPNDKYNFLSSLYLIKTQEEKYDDKFVTVYNQGTSDFFIHNPLNLNLKINKVYEFKYYVKNATSLALVDAKNEWIFIEKNINIGNDLFVIERSFKNVGNLNLFAKYESDQNYKGLCTYKLIE